MTPKGLQTLRDIAQARQNADAAKLKTINAQEQTLRAQLAALDTSQTAQREVPVADTLSMRRIGGDMLWHVWVGRRRRDLQLQLARCLAQKGIARHALRQSFGKRHALEKMQTDLRHKAQKAVQLRTSETMVGMSVLQKFPNRP